VTFEDVAAFIADELDRNEHIGRRVGITS